MSHSLRLATLSLLGFFSACSSDDSGSQPETPSAPGGASGAGAAGSAGASGSNSTAGASGATGGTAGSTATGGAAGSAGAAGGVAGTGGSALGGTAGIAGGAGQGGAASGAAGMSAAGGTNAGSAGTAGTGGDGAGGAGAGGAGAGGAGAGGAGAVGGAGASGAGAGAGGTGGADDGCPTELVGFASVNAEGVNGTTGGGNATPTEVRTLAELKAAVQDSAPRVVVVLGTIRTTDGDGFPLEIASNKTLLGADENATIYGGVTMKGVSNVIIRNLNFHGIWPNSGPDDTISSRNSHHIWYDHLNVWDAGDGMLDITNESDYQTVSWSKFWYTDEAHDHRLASLNGSGGGDHPEDEGHLRVTYHHNWWSELVDQRMPRVMYGDGHQFNNYFHSPGNLYCIGVGSYGSILVENNYFEDVNNPHHFMYALWSHATVRGNVYDNTTGTHDEGYGGGSGDYQPEPFTDPPYAYTLDPAEDVPDIVTRCAGPR